MCTYSSSEIHALSCCLPCKKNVSKKKRGPRDENPNDNVKDKIRKGREELGKKRTLKWANSISALHTMTRIYHQTIGHSLNLFLFRTTSSSHKRTDSQHLFLKHVVRKAVRLERKKEKGVLINDVYSVTD